MQLTENRRNEGKANLLKKLRRNQEFLISNTLSPSSAVWTKWHHERLLANEMDKDFTKSPN